MICVCKKILSLNGKPNSKAEAILQRKHINNKEAQIEEAVQWCKTNGKKGYSALKTGMFPLIKDRGTIDRRLKGKKLNCKMVLAHQKRELLVQQQACHYQRLRFQLLLHQCQS